MINRNDTHETRCVACGSNWSSGSFVSDCPTCGGGALDHVCPTCAGLCGSRWSRAVLDSNESGVAHWIGSCRLPQLGFEVVQPATDGFQIEWWLDDSALPDLFWACMITWPDGLASVLTPDGTEHRFDRMSAAYDWLREDEYDTLSFLVLDDKISRQTAPPADLIESILGLIEKRRRISKLV